MAKEFSKKVYGYDPVEVEKYIESLTKDYEEELDKKKERLTSLIEENRVLTSQLQELNKKLDDYRLHEESVGIAMIKAEESAKLTMAEAERKRQMEIERISMETKKWESRGEEVRHELMAFEEKISELLEKYQSEVNYLASKDVIKTYFKDQSKTSTDRTA